MKPAQYWRHSRTIKEYVHKQGTVISSTMIRTTTPELEYLIPYSYVVVDFGDEKKEMMGVPGEALAIGDTVCCVMRKMGQTNPTELIDYGLKVKKIMEEK